MQYGNVPGIDKPISRLVQGTVMMGSKNADWSFDLLDGVYALGCRAFDTAHGYGSGESERILGRWINERGIRDQVVIITKGAHPYNGRVRVTPEDITSDLHESLERLETDSIDLYLLHRDNPDVPVGPIMDVLNEHHKAGKINVFGGSNWSHERVHEANAYAAAHGLTPYTVSSPNFSLAEQVKEPWPGCLTIAGKKGRVGKAWYAQAKMPLFTWSSLAGGFFSGRFTRDNLDTFTNYFDKVCVDAYCYEENFQLLERVRQMAEEKGVTTVQIAVAYVMSQPLDIYALVGCNTADEFASNVQAMEMKLSPDEMAWLEGS
jgi:aryl-alcohol dehydrogenase-like predicted oxidoreductase